MRDTPYAREIVTASDASGQAIERIFVKAHGTEEVRFSWWPNGNLAMRPLDITEDDLLPLMAQAVTSGVFSQDFLKGLQAVLNGHLGDGPI